jgi:hypothetical protein
MNRETNAYIVHTSAGRSDCGATCTCNWRPSVGGHRNRPAGGRQTLPTHGHVVTQGAGGGTRQHRRCRPRRALWGKQDCVLGTVVLGADDVERAVTFWANVFGYEAVSFPGSDDDFTILIPPDRTGTRIAVHRSITPVQERPRVHVDLVVDNSSEQSSEIERLLGLGATRVL